MKRAIQKQKEGATKGRVKTRKQCNVAIDYRKVQCFYCGLSGGKHKWDCKAIS